MSFCLTLFQKWIYNMMSNSSCFIFLVSRVVDDKGKSKRAHKRVKHIFYWSIKRLETHTILFLISSTPPIQSRVLCIIFILSFRRWKFLNLETRDWEEHTQLNIVRIIPLDHHHNHMSKRSVKVEEFSSRLNLMCRMSVMNDLHSSSAAKSQLFAIIKCM